MKLYVGTDSTWSLRTLVCLGITQLPAEIQIIKLNDDISRNELKRISPTGLVPFLLDGDLLVHDSLAIVEYLHELKCDNLYPLDVAQRAISRSLCAEMHAGYFAVRQEMPFSAQGDVGEVSPSLRASLEIQRIEAIFSQAKAVFFWGENPTAVDAYFSVMAFRLKSYGVNFSGSAGRYQNTLIAWPLFQRSLEMLS